MRSETVPTPRKGGREPNLSLCLDLRQFEHSLIPYGIQRGIDAGAEPVSKGPAGDVARESPRTAVSETESVAVPR